MQNIPKKELTRVNDDMNIQDTLTLKIGFEEELFFLIFPYWLERANYNIPNICHSICQRDLLHHILET